MSHHRSPTRALSRRDALRSLGLIAAGVAVGCTPLRLVLHDYPSELDAPDMLDRVLRAFATAVVPVAHADEPNLVRALGDPYYPFAQYRAFFADDLRSRAERLFGSREFDRLELWQRTAVIQDGLTNGDWATKKLYTGAVYLMQISYYGGIYDSAAGCSTIGYEGMYRFKGFDSFTYPDPERFLAGALTANGNYA